MYYNKFVKYTDKLSTLTGAGNEQIPYPPLPESPKISIREILESGPKPKLIALDLDHTLWPFTADYRSAIPPYTKKEDGVYGFTKSQEGERFEEKINLFPDVPSILGEIYDSGIPIAYTSRNFQTDSVRSLLTLFTINSASENISMIDCIRGNPVYFQVFMTRNAKTDHFTNIMSSSNIEPKDILFFDDESKNIESSTKLGICSILLNRITGLTKDEFVRGITEWRRLHALVPVPVPAPAPVPESKNSFCTIM